MLRSRIKNLGLRLIAHWKAWTSDVNFDADWYLATYRDVAHSGMTPLVHYLAYGRAEGRLPFFGAAAPVMSAYPLGTAPVDKFNQIMWNGFDHWAHPKLVEKASGGDLKAAWYLATWHYAHGQFRDALRWLVSIPKPTTDPKVVVGLIKCYSALDKSRSLRALLSELGVSEPLASILPYAKANSAQNAEERLAAINSVYERNELTPIKVKRPDQPLALTNIAGDLNRVAAPLGVEKGPLVSVVMAAYNASNTIEMAIECLLAQSWHNIEVVVVDDASTDDTLERVRRLASNDSRVRYLESDSNSGAYAARNRGMAQAQGEFVTVHDSDDWSHPQKIEKQVAPLLRSPHLVASYSWWVRVTDKLQCLGSWILGDSFLELNQSSWLIRRSALVATGVWDEVRVGGDVEFATRLQHHFGHAALESVLPEVPLAFSLTDSGSLTRTKATHITTLFHGLRRQYREAFSWWHRQRKGVPIMPPNPGSGEVRPFPIPLGNLRINQHFFSAVLGANFAVQGDELQGLLAFLESARQQYNDVCLLHWPERDAWHGNPIADDVFEWCQRHGIQFAHFGIRVQAHTVVLHRASLWHRPPTRTAQLTGLKHLIVNEGELRDQRAAILAYFSAGGINVEACDETC